MKLILAQGNPGNKYSDTRHNVGFAALDYFAAKNSLSFTDKSKLKAEIAELTIGDEKVLLIKPTTFYNETGQSARAIVDFYKINPAEDLLVIHDDIALPFMTLRVREKGSAAGNNGIKSLNAHLGPDYWRLRVGIYNDMRDRLHDADFVLGKFSASEQAQLKSYIFKICADVIDDFIAGRLAPTSLVHSAT